MTYTELRLFKYRVLIIAIFLTLCSLAASCQIIKVNNGFLITREYAEFIALRFDSLDAYKIAYGECVDRAIDCDALLNKSERLISDMKVQHQTQSDMLLLKDAMIKSYERDAIICNDYKKQLKKETRLKKVWKITTYAFISVSLGALTYSIFK
jgi:hypothetical protein